MNLGYLKNAFIALISNITYEQNILSICKELFGLDNLELVIELLNKKVTIRLGSEEREGRGGGEEEGEGRTSKK